jgi:hypothetical protein
MHVKPLVTAEFAVVSNHQPVLGPRGGYGPFSLCVIQKEDLCHICEEINGLMMKLPIRTGPAWLFIGRSPYV